MPAWKGRRFIEIFSETFAEEINISWLTIAIDSLLQSINLILLKYAESHIKLTHMTSKKLTTI